MTTVINLNLVNFFKLNLDNTLPSEIRQHNQFYNRKQNHPTEDDKIIDITPREQRLVDDSEETMLDLRKPQKTANPVNPAHINKIYDQSGMAIQYLSEKGIFIDTYV